MDQCSILYVKPGAPEETHSAALRALGFSVDVVDDLPTSDVFARYHAVVVRVDVPCSLPGLGARLRAKPRFDRRVLIGLVPESLSGRERREAAHAGFDQTLPLTCTSRDLAASIVRCLRPFPEYRCMLRTPRGRRKAA